MNCNNLSSCFQSIYNFFFAFFLSLTFLYFLYGAFEYLLSGASITKKEGGKSKMVNSIVALIIVLIVPVIINIINPNIFKGVKIELPVFKVTGSFVEISAPETPEEDKLTPKAKIKDYPPNKALLSKLKQKNTIYISKMIVECNSETMQIYNQNNELVATVDIKVSDPNYHKKPKEFKGKKCSNDNVVNSYTTPKGTFTITDAQYSPRGFISKEFRSYMGTRKLTYYAKRGLLIHGGKGDNLAPTAGCIRMRESELAAIFGYIRPGITKLIIK